MTQPLTDVRMGGADRRSHSLIGAKLIAVTCVMASALCLSAQAAKSTGALEKFAGTWKASFKGKTFLTMKLKSDGGTLKGTVSHASVRMNSNGELTEARELAGEDTITSAQLVDAVLRIKTTSASTVNDSSQEINEYEIQVTGDNTAEGRLSGAPPMVKPWKLERVSR